jgi:hypothetical protein
MVLKPAASPFLEGRKADSLRHSLLAMEVSQFHQG